MATQRVAFSSFTDNDGSVVTHWLEYDDVLNVITSLGCDNGSTKHSYARLTRQSDGMIHDQKHSPGRGTHKVIPPTGPLAMAITFDKRGRIDGIDKDAIFPAAEP